MGKFSWDERDPFEGLYRFRRRRSRWPLLVAFAVSVVVGAALAKLVGD
jgi:uncharacterized integral membrane protein